MRGPELGLIFQEPMTRLDPLQTIEAHFREALHTHLPDLDKDEVRRRSLEALAGMGIPRTRFGQYPHEFSGGMRQRIMIALALVLEPKVLIADEPTTALDVIVEAQILGILADLRRNFDTAILLITHNLGIVAEACDRVAVMYAGEIVEEGDAREVFSEPAHPYTRELLRSTISLETTGLNYIPGAPPSLIDPPPACRFHPRCPNAMEVCAERHPIEVPGPGGQRVACWLHGPEERDPRGRARAARARGVPRGGGGMSIEHEPEAERDAGETLLEVRDLHTRYSVRGSFFDRLKGRDSGLGPGRRRRHARPPARRGARRRRRVGLGQDDARPDAARARRGERGLDQARGRGDHRSQGGGAAADAAADADRLPGPARVAEPGDDRRRTRRRPAALPQARLRPRGARGQRATAALERVGLAPATEFLDKYPADLSGGQKQRAVLARAIILDPDVLVADEPVSMLDMSVRAKILELMLELKDELGLTYIYITHDLATAKFFCDRIAIMYLGRIVEIGPAPEIYAQPRAPLHGGAAASDPRARSAPRRPPRPAARRGARRRRPAARLPVPSPLPEGLRGLRLGVPRPADAARGALDEARPGRLRARAGPDRRPRDPRRADDRGAPARRRRRHRGAGAPRCSRRCVPTLPTTPSGAASPTRRSSPAGSASASTPRASPATSRSGARSSTVTSTTPARSSWPSGCGAARGSRSRANRLRTSRPAGD